MCGFAGLLFNSVERLLRVRMFGFEVCLCIMLVGLVFSWLVCGDLVVLALLYSGVVHCVVLVVWVWWWLVFEFSCFVIYCRLGLLCVLFLGEVVGCYAALVYFGFDGFPVLGLVGVLQWFACIWILVLW